MTRNRAANLAPGGRLVALCDDPDIDVDGMSVYSRYGLSITPKDHVGDLRVVEIRMDVEPPVAFTGFHWRSDLVEKTMADAGLVGVLRRQVVAPGHTPDEPDDGYRAPWQLPNSWPADQSGSEPPGTSTRPSWVTWPPT